MKIPITEHFETIQGEGQYAGRPSLFVRTGGCNLRCWWCDTPYTSWNNEGKVADVADLCETIAKSRSPHLVVTGGEPMLFPDAVEYLLLAAKLAHKTTTVETNGTLFDGRVVPDLWSVSPKLRSAAPDYKLHPDEAVRHEKNSHYALTMAEFAARQDRAQFKFVISSQQDVDEVQGQFVDRFGLLPQHIWAMPEGRTREEVLERGAWLAGVCKERGWTLCLRQHVLLWGNRRGV